MLGPFVAAGITAASLRQAASQPAPPTGQPVLPPGFVVRSLDTGEPMPRDFVVFVPPTYSRKRAWPVLVALHGSGEAGTNSHRQLQVGLAPYIARKRLSDFPFVTIFPQVPPTRRVIDGFSGTQGAWVWRMLEQVQKEWNIDPDRVYMTGLSMGGFGSWDLGMQQPDRLAAIAPVCGGSVHPQCIGNLSAMPVWAFHGREDDRVPVKSSRDLVTGLRRSGGMAEYTEYPGVTHNCWDRAYETPALYTWLLKQKRGSTPNKFVYRVPPESSMPAKVWWLRIEAVKPDSAAQGVAWELQADGTLAVELAGISRVTFLHDGAPGKAGRRLVVTSGGSKLFDGAMTADVSVAPGN